MGCSHFWIVSGLIFWLYLPEVSNCVLFNITVDDSGPDPLSEERIIYSPTASWKTGANCTDCLARPDSGFAGDGTWHEGSSGPGTPFPDQILSASIKFDGTAVYIFCIVPHTTVLSGSSSDMSFFIDGQLVGTFIEVPPGIPGYDYNIPVYVNTSISPGQHEIVLQSGHLTNQNPSIILLDSIIYSQDNGIPGPAVPKVSTPLVVSKPSTSIPTQSLAVGTSASSLSQSLVGFSTSTPAHPSTGSLLPTIQPPSAGSTASTTIQPLVRSSMSTLAQQSGSSHIPSTGTALGITSGVTFGSLSVFGVCIYALYRRRLIAKARTIAVPFIDMDFELHESTFNVVPSPITKPQLILTNSHNETAPPHYRSL